MPQIFIELRKNKSKYISLKAVKNVLNELSYLCVY